MARISKGLQMNALFMTSWRSVELIVKTFVTI